MSEEIENLWKQSDECIKRISELCSTSDVFKDATEKSIFILVLRLLRVYESIKSLKGISCQGIFILQRVLWEIAVELAYIVFCFETEQEREEYTKQYQKVFWLDYIKIKASEIGKAWLALCEGHSIGSLHPHYEIMILIDTIKEKKETFLLDLPQSESEKILDLISFFEGTVSRADMRSLNQSIEAINKINIEIKLSSGDQSFKNKWNKLTKIQEKQQWNAFDRYTGEWMFRHSSILGNSSIHSASALVSEMLDDTVPAELPSMLDESNDRETDRVAGFIIDPLRLAYQAFRYYKNPKDRPVTAVGSHPQRTEPQAAPVGATRADCGQY
jgi:hypothetical protein